MENRCGNKYHKGDGSMNVPMLLNPKVNTTYLMAGSSVGYCLEKTLTSGYSAVPVLCDDGRYFGTVSCRDFLKFTIENSANAENTYVSEITDTSINPAVSIDADISELLERLTDSNFVPVVDDRECFVGIVTRKSILSYLQKSCSISDWNSYSC
jgi:predicted transcriptional regulator